MSAATSLVRLATIVPFVVAAAAPAVAADEWVAFDGGPGTICADGSEPSFFERTADPQRVVLYFEGGGACWSEETCAFDNPDQPYRYSSDYTAESMSERGGIFDFQNPENPLADHSWVYAPYCTGDLHLGDMTRTYGDLVIEHRGAVNAGAALDHLVEQFPDATELVVAGVSAGSVPTPLYAALVADSFPEARIVTLGDGSGGYPDEPVVNAFLSFMWGVLDAAPDWPETADLSVDDWSAPSLYVHGGRRAPQITFARFDFAFDGAQVGYIAMLGMGDDELVAYMDGNEAEIEAEGVPVASYTAPGDEHTLLWRDLVYEIEVEGVRLIDWITELVAGGTPDDVHCVVCR